MVARIERSSDSGVPLEVVVETLEVFLVNVDVDDGASPRAASWMTEHSCARRRSGLVIQLDWKFGSVSALMETNHVLSSFIT